MLRVGAVSYLNTKPLIHGLRQRLSGIGTLSLNLPSRLADDLAAGRLDVALIPSIEFFRGGSDYKVISDAAIACRGPVWSVRLLSRVPIPQIRTLALDEGSRTSAALVQILLSDHVGIRPRLVPLAMEQTPEKVDADAVLMIGDRAMHPPRGVYRTIWDLGERWCSRTSLPFVFAPWVARSGLDVSEIEAALNDSRDDGVANLRRIAEQHAPAHGLSVDDLHRYFTDNLHFRLGSDERRGLELYRQKAMQLGLIESDDFCTTETLTQTSIDEH